MILKARNKRPVISFGLGRTVLTIAVGAEVSVFQSTPYLDSMYSADLSLDEIDSTKISNYLFALSPTIAGEYKIRLDVATLDKKIEMLSNVITLIVE